MPGRSPGVVSGVTDHRALVTDSGGLLSHSAIIAREYRIPAVVATGSGTATLRDGQVVTVDGTTGQIEVVS